MRRRWTILLLLLALTAAGVAHFLYWYAPRERLGAPGAGDPTAAIFANSTLPVRLWIPYPHQNLAALRRDAPRGLTSTLQLLGVRTPQLRRFGPFEMPPSRSIVVASGPRGEDMIVVAEVYPSIRWVARAAGGIAGNPWLAGGDVESGGRKLRVGWTRGLWWVASDPEVDIEALLAELPPEPTVPAALAFVRTDRELGPLPAGDYRIAGPLSGPSLVFRDGAGQDTTVLDLGGDGSRLEIRLPSPRRDDSQR